MSELIVWTYDWVRQGPRGFVRDLRLRWACETDGELEMFESGAGLLHLARRTKS